MRVTIRTKLIVGFMLVLTLGVMSSVLVSRTLTAPEKQAIEQFLANERKRKVVADDVKALRAAAKIEYTGKYAEGAPAAEAPKSATPSEVAASALASAGAVAIAVSDPHVRPASGVDAATVNRGLGLK